MVTSGRFELPTSRLGGERSIQLSYEAKYEILVEMDSNDLRLGGGHSVLLSYEVV